MHRDTPLAELPMPAKTPFLVQTAKRIGKTRPPENARLPRTSHCNKDRGNGVKRHRRILPLVRVSPIREKRITGSGGFTPVPITPCFMVAVSNVPNEASMQNPVKQVRRMPGGAVEASIDRMLLENLFSIQPSRINLCFTDLIIAAG
ncbi:hypothetical protein FF011L_27110 [Roseimaritima multifibrata]|uniref:Uncharacterized protein n=1 Tax=Roseimaritima multifibrata TaxID=1930274 RepID=A0A517MGC1_9BACT|nr:hypothetical protein FF011L_27110 [Roseimaritima multifibrata]